MKQIFQFIVMSLFVLGLFACDSKETILPMKTELGVTKDFTNSGCQKGALRSLTAKVKPVETLVLKAVKDGYLEFKHLNLQDYCERDNSFSIRTISGDGKLIVMEEVKNGPQPKCQCLYNLGAKLGGFELGKSYLLVFKREKWVLATLSFVYTADYEKTLELKNYNKK